MNGSKNMIMALGASFLFLMFWSNYIAPKPAVVPMDAPVEQQQPIEKSASSPGASAPTPNPSPDSPSPSVEQTEQPAPETVQIDLPAMDATLTNAYGGTVSVQTLHTYKKSLADGAPGQTVIPFALEDQPPLVWMWEAQSTDGQWTKQWNEADVVAQWSQTTSPYRFAYQQGPLRIEKQYTFLEDSYQWMVQVDVINQGNQSLTLKGHPMLDSTQDPTTQNKGGFLSMFQAKKQPVRAISYMREDVERWTFDDLTEEPVHEEGGLMEWAGFSNQYFLMALRPVQSTWVSIDGTATEDQARLTMAYAPRTLNAGGRLSYGLALYAGPKDIDVLEAVTPSMKYAIDLGGWLGGISRFILRALRALYGVLGNYGVAILVLTVVVRLLLFPLAHRQAKSMKKMQLHKPAMDALKEKHGDDREAYSRELMGYMRENKINPAGGCLPLLFQFPIFIALYRVLYNSIELRHAPFVGWIQDLSAHDPYFVLPVLVGITFFFQTRLNPTPVSDPAQQMVMKIMPVLFSVLMIFLPAGLNLYIFVSTLWGIAQQAWVQKAKA
jgi:YidC/Oxa1 family membrane protein insertase